MITMKAIQQLAGQIAREFHPHRIILFGSLASGQPNPDSDADILVIMPYRHKSWEMSAQIRNRVKPTFPLDLLVRSPDQCRERLALGDPFIEEIMRNGKVLYEADHI